MRSVIAILVGAAAVGIYMDQAYRGVLRPQAAIPPLLDTAIHFGLVALIAFLVGFVVRRRGWLAALVAYLIGLAIWVVVDIRPTPPWIPTDVSGIWLAVFVRAITGGLWSALAGAVGSWVARASGRVSARRTEAKSHRSP